MPWDSPLDVIDNRTVIVDGVPVSVRVVGDSDVTPGDFDCYTPDEVAAWRRGDWQYVGVIATVELGGVAFEPGAALWGIDYRTGDWSHDDDAAGYFPETVRDVAREAIHEATETARNLLYLVNARETAPAS